MMSSAARVWPSFTSAFASRFRSRSFSAYMPYTRDFRCLRYSGTLPLFCSVSVFESVFVVAVVMHGHGSCPRVAAG
jgi:hypothetical protein